MAKNTNPLTKNLLIKQSWNTISLPVTDRVKHGSNEFIKDKFIKDLINGSFLKLGILTSGVSISKNCLGEYTVQFLYYPLRVSPYLSQAKGPGGKKRSSLPLKKSEATLTQGGLEEGGLSLRENYKHKNSTQVLNLLNLLKLTIEVAFFKQIYTPDSRESRMVGELQESVVAPALQGGVALLAEEAKLATTQLLQSSPLSHCVGQSLGHQGTGMHIKFICVRAANKFVDGKILNDFVHYSVMTDPNRLKYVVNTLIRDFKLLNIKKYDTAINKGKHNR